MFFLSEFKLLFKNAKIFLIIIFFLFIAIFILRKNFSASEMQKTLNIGVVNYDNSKEFNKFFKIYQGIEELSKFVKPNIISLSEAKKEIDNDKLAAYVILPENFVNNILYDKNQSFSLVVNENQKLNASIIIFFVDLGINLLEIGQDGVYSTCDVASENKISQEVIDSKIFMPLNLKYAMELLQYKNLFDETKVSKTDNLTTNKFYETSILFFYFNAFRNDFHKRYCCFI